MTDTYPPYTSSSGADVDALAKGVGNASVGQVGGALPFC